MTAWLLDTDVVSILFNRNHRRAKPASMTVAGHAFVNSFMTRAKLLL